MSAMIPLPRTIGELEQICSSIAMAVFEFIEQTLASIASDDPVYLAEAAGDITDGLLEDPCAAESCADFALAELLHDYKVVQERIALLEGAVIL